MGKRLQQIILLTRKNLRIRFSHRGLTFCELGIPLLFALLLGIFVSYYGRSENTRGKLEVTNVGGGRENSVKNKFKCEDTDDRDDSYDETTSYYCAKRYSSINRVNRTISVYEDYAVQHGQTDQLPKKVVFVVARKVAETRAGLELVDAVIESAMKQTRNTTMQYYNNVQTFSWKEQLEWERSGKTEREVEICVLQRHPECYGIFAVVVVTEVEDGVKEKKRIRVDYKIRMITLYNFRYSTLYRQPLFVDHSSLRAYNLIAQLERYYYTATWRQSVIPLGFLELQALVDGGIMQLVTARLGKNASSFGTDQVDISLVRMPFVIPKDSWLLNKFALFPLVGCLLASLPISSLMQVNTEKRSGFKQLLRMHGVSIGTQWMAWLLSTFVVYAVWTLVLTVILWIPLMGGVNALTLLDVNMILFWLLLLLFMMAVTSFSYLISVFFERVWTAACAGLLIWIWLTVLMMLMSGVFHGLTTGTMITLMLIPTVTFDFAFRLILNGGGTLATFGVPVIENVSLTVLHCLGMFLIVSGVHMTLAVYLDNVVPSKYGVSESPWYILRNFKTYLRNFPGKGGITRYKATKVEDDFRHGRMSMEALPTASYGPCRTKVHQQPFETEPEDAEAALILNNLKMQYRDGKKWAVDGLSGKMFTGEIYALLGFHGAGKTTTFGMLAGLLAPTAGWATIFDLEIRKNLEEIRGYMGVCPQHNLLNDNMSVLDHVIFFGRLKGLLDPEDKAKELLTSLGMEGKFSSYPEELSEGQKRLVHLTIALIGDDTKVALLDEPTSGLDIESRRRVGDVLLKLRGKMTIVLTTHDTEEADRVADRVGIMSEGKIMCSGTPSFLKKYYGLGYNLKMTAVAGHCDPNKVFKLVGDFIPSASFNLAEQFAGEEDTCPEGQVSSVVSITLPTAQLDFSRVADMMDAIRQEKGALGVDNIGLSLSTMDEVVLKVGEAARVVDIQSPALDPSSKMVAGGSSDRYEGNLLAWYRLWALLLKRAAYYWHAPFNMILLIAVFTVSLWLSITLLYSSLVLNEESDPPQVVLSSSSLEQYHSPIIAFFHDSEMNDDGRKKVRNTTSYAISYRNQLLLDSKMRGAVSIKMLRTDATLAGILWDLKNTSLQDLDNYRQKYLTGASFNSSVEGTNITGFYSAYGFYTAPLSLNLISQARIWKMNGVAADIRVVDHPIRKLNQFQYTVPGYVTSEYIYLKVSSTVIVLVIISSLLTSTAGFLPAEERLNKGKQLQLMTGTTPFIYWITMFTWDFAFFSLANVIITLVYFLAESSSDHKIFTGHGAGAVIYLILECHTFGALWFSYLVSWATCVKTPSDGFLIVNKFTVIVGVLANVIRHYLILLTVYDFQHDNASFILRFLYYVGDVSGYVLWPVPMHSLYMSMMKLAAVGYKNNICNTFPTEILHMACQRANGFERSQNDTWFMHSCCGNCQENCFQPQAYLSTAQVELLPGYESHSLVFDLIAMLVSGLGSALILYFLEYELPKMRAMRRYYEGASASGVNKVASQDEDVLMEADRINSIVKGDSLIVSPSSPAFIAQNLYFNINLSKTDASGLSFGVFPGECFGLLEVSGGGKTSTLRVITGELNPTSGILFSGGQSYHEQRPSYLASMGYCPQFDGIIGRLSGLQMVKLYGALRGMSPGKLSEEARILLEKFGLQGSANLKCAAYSGGMKRRLSVAMALIGNPQLIVLDEPTSGVDPAFRRQFWNIIQQLKGNGQSILLTSCTMDECEALCTRLGIMVDGQFKCLGSPRHLKTKFGQGYILTVKLKKIGELDGSVHQDLVHRLQEQITQRFLSSRVQSVQKELIRYEVPNKSLWYSHIFRIMEQICNDSLSDVQQVIEEYSVTEPSLEDVFTSFANTSPK